jgi:transcriptional regulator with XRE-family HTH domain
MSLELNQHLGKQLRARRSSLGLTQTQVARAINVTFQQIQKYEKGTNGVSSSRLLQLANFLKVPFNYFFEEFKDFQNLDSHVKNDNSLENFVSKLSEVEKEKLLNILNSNKKLSKIA